MRFIVFLFSALCAACVTDNSKKTDKVIQPPICKKKFKELTIHDHTRVDNYFWLNERANPEVTEYLNQENAYLDSMLAHTDEFQNKLFKEIKGRIKQTDESVPFMRNGYLYYNRFEEGKQYRIYCRKKNDSTNPEEILIDQNILAQNLGFHQMASMSVSPNNKLLAFSEDTVSRRIYTIKFKNLETGEYLPNQIEGTNGSVAWANDNQTVFYSKKNPETLRTYQVWRHTIGSSEDQLVYEEKDETFSCYARRSKSGNYIIISSHSTLTMEHSFLDASNPTGEFKVFQPRERGLEYEIANFGDHFYVVTNWNAKNFRLMKTSASATAKENWQEIIPHRDDVLLEDLDIFSTRLILQERKNGIPMLRIMENDGADYYMDFGEEVYLAYASANFDYDAQVLRYRYTSLTTPWSTLEYDFSSRKKNLLKQEEVLGSFKSDNYVTERHYATAHDGTRVPISLVYKKGLQKNGNNPLLLYGYGSYGHSMDVYFNSARLSLLDRGFVFAIAHIRGGQELGREWYENGKLLNKKNTFTDFIACGEHLIAQKFTSKEKLFAMGGSAGGLLMGAIINMRPDLWKGVVASVPFVDVISTMLDENIPLTTGEYDEWGNPNEKKYYDYILEYSPYDNVKTQNYPNMLVITGFHDSQVQYWEPAKWVAKLREVKTDHNLLIFKTNMEAGHGGASGRFEHYKETALTYAFLLDLAGITQ